MTGKETRAPQPPPPPGLPVHDPALLHRPRLTARGAGRCADTGPAAPRTLLAHRLAFAAANPLCVWNGCGHLPRSDPRWITPRSRSQQASRQPFQRSHARMAMRWCYLWQATPGARSPPALIRAKRAMRRASMCAFIHSLAPLSTERTTYPWQFRRRSSREPTARTLASTAPRTGHETVASSVPSPPPQCAGQRQRPRVGVRRRPARRRNRAFRRRRLSTAWS